MRNVPCSCVYMYLNIRKKLSPYKNCCKIYHPIYIPQLYTNLINVRIRAQQFIIEELDANNSKYIHIENLLKLNITADGSSR